jgi:hypothetical protein
VGVAVYGTPQDCKRRALCFASATVFCVCFGVGYAISTTRHTWIHVEYGAVCLWRYMPKSNFSPNSNIEKKQQHQKKHSPFLI